jgi:hypothetical protein
MKRLHDSRVIYSGQYSEFDGFDEYDSGLTRRDDYANECRIRIIPIGWPVSYGKCPFHSCFGIFPAFPSLVLARKSFYEAGLAGCAPGQVKR